MGQYLAAIRKQVSSESNPAEDVNSSAEALIANVEEPIQDNEKIDPSLPNEIFCLIANFLPNDDIYSATLIDNSTSSTNSYLYSIADMSCSAEALIANVKEPDIQDIKKIKSSLPSEIFSNITNFLPNDDITDLMLMSRKFNALVTPRLKKIDEDRATMNQSIKSFMPMPTPENKDTWVADLNIKRFEPIGSVAKKRMKELFANHQKIEDCLHKYFVKQEKNAGALDPLKEGMSLERFDDTTFFIPISTSPTNSYLAMSFLPNEIFYDITNFLPNDDITDQMLLSRNFNALVTPRLQKIDQEMTTMNQSIESFMPSPAPADNEWIFQLNLKRFEPIGSEAKQRMKTVLENRDDVRDCLLNIEKSDMRSTLLPKLKERMSLERFDDPTFLRILGALIAQPKFRQEYNVWPKFPRAMLACFMLIELYGIYPNASFDDVKRILEFYKKL
ncbi:hypothetical protein DdX_17024 [Ditylenchus destructor]|uniref:F-box domain-containing protein n=1 Tax=Ditylenchus destructor TaxID=166010 RepID=A0AAD4QW63_9BILA|nr:hypothetical protein DdX_17024 [Ditylenchus destructor]